MADIKNKSRLASATLIGGKLKYPLIPFVEIGDEKYGNVQGTLLDANAVASMSNRISNEIISDTLGNFINSNQLVNEDKLNNAIDSLRIENIEQNLLYCVINTNEDGLYIVDKNLNIGATVNDIINQGGGSTPGNNNLEINYIIDYV